MIIMEGWPENKLSLSRSLTPYYSYRDEMTLHDGIILHGEQVVVPASMQ